MKRERGRNNERKRKEKKGAGRIMGEFLSEKEKTRKKRERGKKD